MKNSLLFHRLSVSIILMCYFINTNGQTVIFSEDFSGFTQGNHTNPYNIEITDELDLRTHQIGWSGYKVYSAGGEIKLGTSTLTGWIETPLITFSGFEGTLTLRFDICRWPGDATTVRVLLDGVQIGSTLTPTNEFQTVEIQVTPGVQSGKIKFEAISKRFYLDNVSVVSVNTPTSIDPSSDTGLPSIYPNPARDIITMKNISDYKTMEILDIQGKICLSVNSLNEEMMQLSISGLRSGIYIVSVHNVPQFFSNRQIF